MTSFSSTFVKFDQSISHTHSQTFIHIVIYYTYIYAFTQLYFILQMKGFVKRLYAYLRIKELLEEALIASTDEERETRESIALRLSLENNFVTPLTSLVVVQPRTPSRGDMMEEKMAAGFAPGSVQGCSVSVTVQVGTLFFCVSKVIVLIFGIL